MLFTENNRAVVQCNRCPVRLDLGPEMVLEHRLRMPSMWKDLGENRHLCPSCNATYRPRFSREPGRVTLRR